VGSDRALNQHECCKESRREKNMAKGAARKVVRTEGLQPLISSLDDLQKGLSRANKGLSSLF
jgi:hypothetical protein